MIIVGLTGGIGHGKTTLAEYLALHAKKHRNWEASDIVAEVANTLRHEKPEHPAPSNIASINSWLSDLDDIIATCVHAPADFTQLSLTTERVQTHPENYAKLFEYLTAMQDQPHLQTVEITRDTKRAFRPLLQWLGGYLMQTVDYGIWFDEIIRRIHQSQAEGLELATVGGVRFPSDAERIRNAGGLIIEVSRPGQESIDVHDFTERQRQRVVADVVVRNDGSLEQLRALADTVYKDLRARSLRAEYLASAI